VPSVGITIFFLVLCAKEQLWTSKDVLNVMQFAAKIHEILIIASLSNVVLHRVRYCLLKPEGIQLGLLASSFQVSSFLYHTKTEFWGAIWFTHPTSLNSLCTAILLVSSFILATLAGPTSAIIMVPKLDWYKSVRTRSYEPVAKVFVKATHDQLYPKDINQSLVPEYCSWNNATRDRACPSHGLLSILASSFADGVKFVENTTTTVNTNITFGGPEEFPLGWSEFRNVETVVESDNNEFRIQGALSPPDFVSNVLMRYKKATRMQDNYYLSDIKFRVIMGEPPISRSLSAVSHSINGVGLMPFVATRCIHSPLGSSDILFAKSAFDDISWNTTAAGNGTIVNSSLVLAEDLSEYHLNTTFMWLESDMFPQYSPLAGVFVIGSGDGGRQGHVISCVVEGRWIEAEFANEAGLNSPIVPRRQKKQDWKISKLQKPIQIDVNWARSQNNILDPLFAGHSNNSNMDLLGGHCAAKVLRKQVQGESGNWNFGALEATVSCLEFALSIFVTDGLARIQALVPVEVTEGKGLYSNFTTMDLRTSVLYTEIPVREEYFGYGYNMRGPLIKLAFVALLLHSLLAIVHIVIILRSKKSSTSWNRIGDLVTLALNSNPSSRLTNTGGGVGRGRTWAIRVKVEPDEHDRLGFIVGPDNDTHDKVKDHNGIMLGKKYI
jgi:hypothetical protein